MKTFIVGWTVTIAIASMPTYAQEDLDYVIVTGINAPTTTSTGLPLKFMETPQSVTIIDQKRIQDFALTNVKDLLDQVVGVNVERSETDRTTFDARGFDVTNFQIDGIGLPLIGNLYYGDTDSFLYDRIDIIRGANGLTTGIGNPSATINYVRKRPLEDFNATAAVYGGSWNKWRTEADVSIPVNDRLAVRVIGAREESDSYLDKYHTVRTVAGVVAAGKITPDLTLTLGYNQQNNTDTAPTWGSLTLLYSDGTPVPYRRSDNPAPSWTRWPLTERQAYSELAYSRGTWETKAVLTYRRYEDKPLLDYQYGAPDRVTGTGYAGDIALFETADNRYLADLYSSGTVNLFGRDHKLTFGASYAEDRFKQWQAIGTGYYPYPDFNAPDRFDIPEPSFPELTPQEEYKSKLARIYAASQINFTDRLKAVVGTSWAKLDTGGDNYDATLSTHRSKFNPYAGVLFDITSILTAYASYTTIFSPQTQQAHDRTQLGPIEGTNMEAGLKANLFERRLYASATVFKTQEKGLATPAGVEQETVPPYNFFYYYVGDTVEAKGFELEVAGRVTPNWSVGGGYTKMTLKDKTTGEQATPWIARQTLKASTTYTFPQLRNLSLGAQLRWQNDVDVAVDPGSFALLPGVSATIRQPAYAILDLQSGIELTQHLHATLVVRNVTDKRYLSSLAYAPFALGLYGADRNFTGSLAYRF